MLVLCLALLLSLPVRAEPGELWNTEAIESQLPAGAEEYMAGESILRMNGETLERILRKVETRARELWAEEVRFCVLLLSVVLLCSMATAGGGRARESVILAGIAAVSAAAVTDVNSFMELSAASLEELSGYADILLPVLAAAGSVSGQVSSMAGKCAATAVFMNTLILLSRELISPLICGYAALSIANAAVGNNALKTAAKLTHSGCTLLLGALATAFTLWLSAISLIAGAGGEAAVRITKAVLTNALPVVGKVLSDASGALSAAASAVRGSAGVFGMGVVLCTCLTPCLRLGMRLLVFKFTAAVCQCLCSDRLSSLLDALGECFALQLALLGTAALSLFIAVYSLIKVVL